MTATSRRRRNLLPLLTALALIALTGACGGGPSDKSFRALATSAKAEAARATAEQRIHDRIGQLAAVAGLEQVTTLFRDRCDRRPPRSVFDGDRPNYDLRCEMTAVAYFGVRGDIADVLPRIRAARITQWGGVDDWPTASGTVAYALAYLRSAGRYADGSLMATPELRSDVSESPHLTVDWDRSKAERPQLLAEPTPCPPPGVYQRCASTPDPPPTLAEARARYGTILQLGLGGWGPDGVPSYYFTVPRA